MSFFHFGANPAPESQSSASSRKPVQSPLTLIMTIRSREDFEALNTRIHEIQSRRRRKIPSG